MHTNTELQIREAIDAVLAWDLPDDAFGSAVIAQAEALAAGRWE